ncbi:hypothetical protein MMC12_006936 [Toensbergia leucococca]|nr:hypothetical protein [Toensbergia leucococca]
MHADLPRLYFEIDAFNLHTHAIRRHMISYFVWLNLHLPFIMSFVLAASALSKLVIAHDCPDADPTTLSETSRLSSNADLTSGLRWYYCAGLGIALACMGGISAAHEHKEIKGQRIYKRHRLTIRFAVAIIITLLPLATHLDSLQLIATTTGLLVCVLLVDLYGSTCTHDPFWKDKRGCKYSAACRLRKKDVEEVARTGAVVDLRELARENQGEKGLFNFH